MLSNKGELCCDGGLRPVTNSDECSLAFTSLTPQYPAQAYQAVPYEKPSNYNPWGCHMLGGDGFDVEYYAYWWNSYSTLTFNNG